MAATTDKNTSDKSGDPVFVHGSTLRHVIMMSFTSSIGLMAIFAVDLIDMLFISMLGQDALAAAAGYASTLLFFTNSINIGLSIAAGALVAQALGRKERQEAREYATSVAMVAFAVGLIVPVILLWNLQAVLALFGAEGEVADLAAGYLMIILPSMSVIGVAMTGMAVLRAHGDAKWAMYSTLVGGLVNAVLDPIFIFGLGLDLQGAAMASVVSRFAFLAAALWPAIRRHNGFDRPGAALLMRDAAAVSKIAVPAVLTNVATPVGSAILTREMAKYGTEAVAGMAVIGRLTPVAFSVVLALSGAIGPIIAQNFGAGLHDWVRSTFLNGLKFIAGYVLLAVLILFALRAPIADMFGATGLTRDLIYLFCGPLALVTFFNGAMFVANASFNNLGHPVYSTWLNWCKNTIGTWPFVVGGAALWGAQGALIGQAAGATLFSLIAVALALRVVNDPALAKPTQDPFIGHRRMHVMSWRGRW